jgi:calcineurin-like phosphoesterase family protein
MSHTFFTSDLHINHRLVARERGFLRDGEPDIEAHNDLIADSWDRIVRPDDRVFVLGDVAMNFKPEVAEWVRARPGRKFLISGNHDACHPMHSSALKALPKFREVFEEVQPFLRIKVQGTAVALSHFPYFGEGVRDMEDRHTQWRLRDEGMPLLHGHTHEKGVKAQVHNMLHVGLDGWGLELVHEDTVAEWLDTL